MKPLTRLFSTTLVVSFIHSFCCFLPFITLAFGLASLPFYLGFLTILQPYLIVLQAIVLVYGFYKVYFERPNSGNKKEKIALWVILFLTALMIAFPYYRHAQAQSKPQFGMKIIRNIK
jgi:hypothetical protein